MIDLTRARLACAKCGDTAVFDLLTLPVDPATGAPVSVEVDCPNSECGAGRAGGSGRDVGVLWG